LASRMCGRLTDYKNKKRARPARALFIREEMNYLY
jgi:hypothetical protein